MRSWPDEKADMNRHSLARTRSRNSRGAPRVGLFGLLGQGNLGNDGSLEAVLGYLRAAHPDAILDFMCGGPEEMTARYGIPAVRLRWHNAPPGKTPGALAFARAGMETTLGLVMDGFHTASWVRRHDVVIVPGMGVLEATLPLRAWHTPYSMFLLSATGRLFGTKVALVSVGADFMDQRAMRWLVTMAARLAHYRSYRDSFSRDAMRRMGLRASDDPVYPDLAFALPTPSTPSAPAGDPGSPGPVGVGVMDFSGGNQDRHQAAEIRTAYVEKMKLFVLWLADNGRPVRLFTTDVHDEPVMHEIVHDLRARRPGLDSAQILAEPTSSLDELMRKMATVDTVVASRFHNVLCALKLAKPTLSVGYAAKFGALMTDMGLGEFCQSARDLDVDRLIEQFTVLESRSAELRHQLNERNTVYTRLLDQQFGKLSDSLFPPTGSADAPARQRRARVGAQ
jgi:polysaccharide pyruvyl transferase WcaK-like protein